MTKTPFLREFERFTARFTRGLAVGSVCMFFSSFPAGEASVEEAGSAGKESREPAESMSDVFAADKDLGGKSETTDGVFSPVGFEFWKDKANSCPGIED